MGPVTDLSDNISSSGCSGGSGDFIILFPGFLGVLGLEGTFFCSGTIAGVGVGGLNWLVICVSKHFLIILASSIDFL